MAVHETSISIILILFSYQTYRYGSPKSVAEMVQMIPVSNSLCFYGIEIEINMLRPEQNEYHFVDIFRCVFLTENLWLKRISLKHVCNAINVVSVYGLIPLGNMP